MNLDHGPPPGDPGDVSHFCHFDSNQLATQVNYSHDNDGNIDCEEIGLETVDFGTYAATLTASNTDADANADADVGNKTLEMMLRNTALPEEQIQAIWAANKNETTGKNETPQTGKNEMCKNEMHDDEDKKFKLAKITPTK